MGARRRTRQGLSIHVESVLGKGISMQIETVAKEGFLPVRVHPTDAGADLRADIPEPVTLQPRESTFFNTGIEVAIPEGYFGAVGETLQPCLQAWSDACELSWNYRFVLSGSRKGEVGEHRKAPLHDQPRGPYRSIAHYPMRPCNVCPG